MELLQVVSRPRLNSTFCSLLPTRVPSSKGTTFGRKTTSSMFAVHSSGQEISGQIINERRSANYKPNVLSYNLLQSLDNITSVEMHKERIQVLEKEVRNTLIIHHESCYDSKTGLAILEQIDDIQRLGLIYRFEEDVKNTLRSLPEYMEQQLHAVSLSFRLRRQHGLDTSQDAFKRFLDNQGNIIDSSDIKGMLSLYDQAVHLATEEDDLLQEAKAFVTKHLQCYIETNYNSIDENLLEQLNHALELPLHRRISLQDSQWYIKAFSRRPNADCRLLELAVLEFNLVQSIYKEDLQFISRWWENVGLTKSLSFARDRPVECFFWALGMTQHPRLSNCRRHLSKVTTFITIIDDIYDVYGLPDELNMFTDAVERWDIHSVNDLPDYMKLCFLALYNTVNEIGYDVLKEHGVNVVPYLAKSWADLFKAFLKEAEWCRDKLTPKFSEYLKNGRVSVSGHVLLVHSYFMSIPRITNQAIQSLHNYEDVCPWPSTVFRLWNDLASSSAELEREETANSISCYMLETGVSEEIARQHVLILQVETHKEKIEVLEKEVRDALIHETYDDGLAVMELIDDIQKLGLSCRFEEDILRSLSQREEQRMINGEQLSKTDDLYAVSLNFRIRRQHGLHASQDAFKRFMDIHGNFVDNDVKGYLSLYEAAHLATEGEYLLQQAKAFATNHLQSFIKTAGNNGTISKDLQEQVSDALKCPLHRRVPLQKAQCYIKAYSRRPNADRRLLELATFEFNRSQSIYKEDLQFFIRWWESTGLTKHLNFARDKPVECFFWALGMAQHPQLSNCRRQLSKVASFITVIDDIYDVYGLPDELNMFTTAVERWDIHSVNDLPDYMKLCFLALYNTVNEVAYDVLKDHGVNIVPYLAKTWADLFKSFLEEAMWCKKKTTPKFREYLKNGSISSSGHVLQAHAYFLTTPRVTKEALESLQNYDDVLPWPSTILRLCNDLATSTAEMEREEMVNATSCYMLENRVSEEDARKHMNDLIDMCWRKMNEYQGGHDHRKFDTTFLHVAFNLARTAHFVYQNGDGHGNPDSKSNQNIRSLIFEPISFNARN